MSQSVHPTDKHPNRNDELRKLPLALFFLLLSFLCVFCSSQGALWAIDRNEVEARMLSERSASYLPDAPYPLTFFPILDADKIRAEAEQDEIDLAEPDPSEALVEGGLVPLPLPAIPTPTPAPTVVVALPTLTPTPTFVPTLTPTFTPTPISSDATETSVPATSVPATLQPTVPPPATEIAPTAVPPTVAPTLPSTVVPTTPPTAVPTADSPTVEPDPTDTPEPVIPTINFSASSYTAGESDGLATITAILSVASANTVSADLETTDGTAISPDDFTSTLSTLIFVPGQLTQTITIPVNFDTIFEGSEFLSLALSNPVNATLGLDNATLAIVDDDFQPTVQFLSTTYNVGENAGPALITATLSNLSVFTVTANFQSSENSASASADYSDVFGTLTFPPGNALQTFTIPITDDLVAELDEIVDVSLVAPVSNATLGTPASAVLTIIDNEATPQVEFDRLTYSILENNSPALITTTLSSASSLTVTVNYTSGNITALAGSDYLAATGSLTFPPGQVVQTFTVIITDDVLIEPNEDLELALSNPTNATVGTNNPAQLRIIEENQPFVQFLQSTFAGNEDAGTALITVTLDAPSLFPVTVDYTTSDLLATAGQDYSTTTGTLTFPPSQTVVTFTLSILNDNVTNEGSETIALTLSNPNNAILGTTNPATYTINDDDPLPTVNFVTTNSSISESDDGGSGFVNVSIGVELSALSAQPIMIDYSDPGGGTATSGSDYNNFGGTLTIPANQLSNNFDVVVINDTAAETTETVNLQLSNPVNATLGTSNSAITIVDDDTTASPCTGIGVLPGEPNEGAPNTIFSELDCGTTLVITLTTPISTSGNANFDLAYYEIEGNAPPLPGNIYLDQVVVQVGTTLSGPWYTVFYWGDGVLDSNTNIGLAGYGPVEVDNQVIPFSDLYASPLAPTLATGITIDVDAQAPANVYPYIRIYAPLDGDSPNVDSVEALP